jgi:hypothetical protein
VLKVVVFVAVMVLGFMAVTHVNLFGRHELLPAPWLVPKQAGGSALRLAMIHDVLHERFYVHGEAWFRHRHAKAEHELSTYDAQKPKDARYFALLDDLAVDHDRWGKAVDGIPILRRKLDEQQPLDASGVRPVPTKEFYTTYANLGTLLAHQHLKGALAKDPAALAGLHEGLSLIEQSVEVNPDAHFGRERWQVVTLRYLLYANEHSEILTKWDLCGLFWGGNSYPMISGMGFPRSYLREIPDAAKSHRLIHGPRSEEDESRVDEIRQSIPRLPSAPQEWEDHIGTEFKSRIPFDEPALAIIGIWTLGSGANPHFALALAHIMEGLPQRSIAWNAYERAADLAPKFWSDPKIQQQLIDHCRTSQAALERKLQQSATELREQHRTELAFGRAEQQAYQTYEAERIAKGADPDAPDFYDDFFRGRPPIASDTDNADTVAIERRVTGWDAILVLQALVCTLLTAILATKLISRWQQPTA